MVTIKVSGVFDWMWLFCPKGPYLHSCVAPMAVYSFSAPMAVYSFSAPMAVYSFSAPMATILGIGFTLISAYSITMDFDQIEKFTKSYWIFTKFFQKKNTKSYWIFTKFHLIFY